MSQELGENAFGAPGIEARWTHGNKNGVGTAYSASSKIWFTLFGGVVTEVFFPTVDRPQMRDLQYLITDGKSFFHEEKRDLKSNVERLSAHALGFRCTNSGSGRTLFDHQRSDHRPLSALPAAAHTSEWS